MILALLSAAIASAAAPASDTLSVDAVGVDPDGVVVALQLRAPELTVIPSDDGVHPDGANALHVRGGGERYELVLVLEDGRVFRRIVSAQPQHASRVVATAAANLWAAVAEGQVVADEDPGGPATPASAPIEVVPVADATPGPAPSGPSRETLDESDSSPSARPPTPRSQRDRTWRGTLEPVSMLGAGPNAAGAVSYTHLTLPTKLEV
ncbi:MAG: hypothetical protein KUG77_13410 [Nannocystaceae bacterium]|nr:hypothetical protein [Nannocystaceae bacterium]